MYPKPIQRIIEAFSRFPGVGPRQASRFAFFLLKEKNGLLKELSEALNELGDKIIYCSQCFRAIEKNESGLCNFCQNSKRQPDLIAVAEKESDLQNLEKTGEFQGLYHVLGGVISALDPESPKKIHLKELYVRIENILQKQQKAEIILATGATTEGDTTALYIERILKPLADKFPELKISRLGRGLSLGAELEYADEATLKNALKNRR